MRYDKKNDEVERIGMKTESIELKEMDYKIEEPLKWMKSIKAKNKKTNFSGGCKVKR